MSNHPNEEELVASFVGITNIDDDRARFYLEASGWELQVALASFFEGDQDQEAEANVGLDERVSDSSELHDNPGELLSSLQNRHPNLLSQINQIGEQIVAGGQPSVGANRFPSVPERTGPATLDSIRRRQDEDDSSDDEKEKRQAFYAGGSQSSGQQVLGPPKKRDELVAEMFKKARELGAEDVNSGDPSSSKKKPSAAFGGAGYKLGEKSSETERVPPSAGAAVQKPKESREIVLRLWSTGFTVDDGPLRSFVDPANMEFLSSVKHGEIPRELIRDNQGREVELTMEDRRHEEYVAPKPSARPFGGVGQMLGSPSPAVVGGTANLSESDRQANESAARTLIPLVESEPATNIQFRLADGTRLVARFNHTHTVNDLHSYLNTARPQFSALNYVLTIFPNIELTEKGVTVKDANLLNAALIQKIK